MGKLILTPTLLEGAFTVKTNPFEDERGSFNRLFCSEELQEILHGKEIRAINFSHTREIGTIRGLHFQKKPFAEIKMVRCLRGKVFDVMVDIRQESPTFGLWHGELLTPESHTMMFIPEGFAHGFQVLEQDSELLYLHTAVYSKECESGIRFDDPTLEISWPLEPVNISERDLQLSFLK